MILRVKFVEDTAMLQTLNIYQNGSVALRLKDDGVYPDAVANDYKYSILVKQDLTDFLNQIAALESKWQSAGQVTHFYGHSAESIPYSEQVKFDVTAFNNKDEVKFNAFLMDASDCAIDLLKQNSLFITDISVVENTSTTYNIINGTGNKNGAWTFGEMMKNMCNNPYTNVDQGDFLKEWVKLGRMTDEYEQFFIIPWIVKANRVSNPSYTYQTGNTWEQNWDITDVDDLYEMAPFKLTAIVNRLDLRGQFAYNPALNNAGETRFIFTYIIPDDNLPVSMNGGKGNPPFHYNMDFVGNGSHPGNVGSVYREDWKGMNVIFEYSNVQTSLCALQSFANQWADLSYETLGSTDYINQLVAITNTVTNANSNANRPNKSAIARIRTNEKVFAHVNGSGNTNWTNANWEFRQMELNPTTHLFELAPLTNTIQTDHYMDVSNVRHAPLGQQVAGQVFNWVYSSNLIKHRVKVGNFNIPNNTSFLAFGSSEVTGEVVHFFEGLETELGSKYGPTLTQADREEAKMIRHQISLNTCQGCHAGETKVAFTQVRPIGYGVNGDYWSSTPSVVPGTLNTDASPNNQYFGLYFTDFDVRAFSSPLFFYNYDNFKTGNIYSTREFNNTASPNFNVNYSNNYPFQVVSPFLTGRIYNGIVNNTPNWDDDNIDPSEDDNILGSNFYDNTINGDYWVNDPSNKYNVNTNYDGPFPGIANKKWKFNDLEMRKKSMCTLLGIDCNSPFVVSNNGIKTLDLIKAISFSPLPLGSH
jgi:hypothetical protein